MFRSNSSNSRARAAINTGIYSDNMIQKYIDSIASFPDLQAQIDVLTVEAGNITISADVSNGIIYMNDQISDLQIHDISNTIAVDSLLQTTTMIESSLNILLVEATNPNNFSKTIPQTITGNIVFSGDVYLTQLDVSGSSLLYHDASGNLTTKSLLTNDDIVVNAEITDNKLAILQTPGKVLPSATNATVLPLPNTIVLRDGSGDILALTLPSDVSDNRVATTQFVQNNISLLVDSSPETLNTLNELSNAIGGDASFSQTIYAELDKKVDSVNPTFGANVFASSIFLRNSTADGIIQVDASGTWTSGAIQQEDISSVVLTNAQLQTISTPGKVENSATTATTDSSANTIMVRGASGEWVNPCINGVMYNTQPGTIIYKTSINNIPYINDNATILTRAQSEKALTNWRFSTSSVNRTGFRNIMVTYDFTTIFAVDSGGITYTNNGGNNWQGYAWPGSGQTAASPYGLAFMTHTGYYVVVGDNFIRITNNFSTYTTVTPPSTNIWKNVVYSSKLLTTVAVGLNAVVYSNNVSATIWASANSVPLGDWTTVAWSPDISQFVAVGPGVAMYSPNGITWTASTNVPDGAWSSIVWAPELNMYCAVAPTGTYRVMVSSDGIVWRGINVPEMNAWQSVCWSPDMGMFCAVSNDGTNRLMRSFDGVNWKTFPLPLNTWRLIAWYSQYSVFVVLHTSATGQMLVSSLNSRIPTADTFFASTIANGTGSEWIFQSTSISSSSIINAPDFSGNISCGTITNTINPITTNTNVSISNGFGITNNRALYRAFQCVDTSGVGDLFDVSQVLITGTVVAGDIWTATSTYRRLASITLSPGTWNITYGMALVPSGTSGDISGVETYLCTVDASNQGLISGTESYDYTTYSLVAGSTYPFFPQKATINVAATTTYYLNGYLDFGAGITALATIGVGGEDTYIYAHRVSTYMLDVAEMAKYFLQYPTAQGAQTFLDLSGAQNMSASRMMLGSIRNATSATDAPIIVSGGAVMRGNVYLGGNVYPAGIVSDDVRITDTNSAAAPVSGVAEGKQVYVNGTWTNTNMSGSGNTVFTLKNSALINSNMVVNYEKVIIPYALEANSSINGALTVVGGISTQNNVYAGNVFATNVSSGAKVSVYSSAIPNSTSTTNGILLANTDVSNTIINATPITGMNNNTYLNPSNGLTYIASASSYQNINPDIYYPYYAFDGNNATFWHCAYTVNPYNTDGTYKSTGTYNTVINEVGTISGEWLQIQFPFPIVMTYYMLRARSDGGISLYQDMPREYYIAGSNNGSTWYSLDYRSDPSTTGVYELSYNLVNNITSYSYYRLAINKIYGQTRQVTDFSEWRIRGYADSPVSKYNIGISNQSNERIQISTNANDVGNRLYSNNSSFMQMDIQTANASMVSVNNQLGYFGNVKSFGVDNVGNVFSTSTSSSNSTTSGALVVNGGVGVRGNLNVGGNITIFDGANTGIIDQSLNTMEIKNPTESSTRIVLSAPNTFIDGQLSRVSGNVSLTSASYTPADIPGLRLWFDANDAASVQITGGFVSQWNDKSGFNAHATPTSSAVNTYGTTLYNGLPGIQFNAAGFVAPLPAGQLSRGITFFGVFQKNGTAQSFEALFSRSLNNTYPSPFDIYNAVRLLGNGTTFSNQTSGFDIRNGTGLNILSGAIAIQSISGSQAIYNEWVNGTSQMINPIVFEYGDTASGLYIGTRAEGGTNFRGVMSEVIVYNRVLSDTEREVVEGYLATKWNMRSNLVAYHPYKNVAPTYNPTLFTRYSSPILNNSKLHSYMYANANLTTPNMIVVQNYSLMMPNLTYVGLGGGNILYNVLGKLRAGTIVNGCFFYISGSSTNCQFGIYKGGANTPLLAQTSSVTISSGVNYIPFTANWIVPSTDIYYIGLRVAGTAVSILCLPSSSTYSYGYTTMTTGVLNRACQYTSVLSGLPATMSNIGLSYSNYNAWVGLYASAVPLQPSISPTNLSIAELTSNSIRITYTANPAASSYVVRTNPATSTITTTSNDVTISSVPNTDTVQYTVYVYGVDSRGYVSAPSTIMTLLPPSTVSVGTIGDTYADITYSVVAGATYYEVESIPSTGIQSSNTTPIRLTLTFATNPYTGIRMRSTMGTSASLWKTYNITIRNFASWPTSFTAKYSFEARGCAISYTGQYQFSCNNFSQGLNGTRYSHDYGTSWLSPTGFAGWSVMPYMSGDGKYQLLLDNNGGGYSKSSNYGVSFTALGFSFVSGALSYDGQYQTTGTQRSINYGANWSATTGAVSPAGNRAVCMSYSGQYQTLVGNNAIYRSIDYGANWAQVSGTSGKAWITVAMSGTGQFQSACITNGQIWNSIDYGATWTVSSSISSTWNSISINETGQFQVASNGTTTYYYSKNYGVNWTSTTVSQNIYNIAISGTGQYMIYTGGGASTWVSVLT